MHMKGTDPRTMQDDLRYDHLLGDIAAFLADAAKRAVAAGVAAASIAIDPGLGFGKAPEDSLVLLRHLGAFGSLGLPVVAGASRKGFVRRFSGVAETASAAERLPGLSRRPRAAAAGGASIVRVHDVADSVRFLRMSGAIARAASAPAAVPGAAAR